MDTEDFEKLDSTVQISLIIAMYIRNEMENFHCAHLSDEQMKELNTLMRQSIYNILRYLKLSSKTKNDAEKIHAKNVINLQIQLIPKYWELPTEEAFQGDENI